MGSIVTVVLSWSTDPLNVIGAPLWSSFLRSISPASVASVNGVPIESLNTDSENVSVRFPPTSLILPVFGMNATVGAAFGDPARNPPYFVNGPEALDRSTPSAVQYTSLTAYTARGGSAARRRPAAASSGDHARA